MACDFISENLKLTISKIFVFIIYKNIVTKNKSFAMQGYGYKSIFERFKLGKSNFYLKNIAFYEYSTLKVQELKYTMAKEVCIYAQSNPMAHAWHFQFGSLLEILYVSKVTKWSRTLL